MNFSNDTASQKRTFSMPRRSNHPQTSHCRSKLMAGTTVYAETFPTRPVQALEKMGATPVGSSPRDFRDAFMRTEAAKWEPVLEEADIKMQ
jgi:hypothetical protein